MDAAILKREYTITVKIPYQTATLAMLDDLEEILMERGTAQREERQVVSTIEIEAGSLFNLGWEACQFVQEMEQKLRCADWDDFTIESAP
jgi:hypothetical protein